MNRINQLLEIEEIYEVTEEGATLPIRARMSNGEDVIVKYPNNNCGNQVLVNEFVCACIADILEMNIPEFGICQLPQEIIMVKGPELGLDVKNAGLCFFTKNISSSIPISFGTLMTLDPEDFDLAKLIVYDHVICNRERHDGNMILEVGDKKQLYLIDHGTIFTHSYRYSLASLSEETDEQKLNDTSILKSNENIYRCLRSRFSYNEEKVSLHGEEIKRILSKDVMDKIKKMIPQEWIFLCESGTIEKLIDAISFRIANIDKICNMIIREGGKF